MIYLVKNSFVTLKKEVNKKPRRLPYCHRCNHQRPGRRPLSVALESQAGPRCPVPRGRGRSGLGLRRGDAPPRSRRQQGGTARGPGHSVASCARRRLTGRENRDREGGSGEAGPGGWGVRPPGSPCKGRGSGGARRPGKGGGLVVTVGGKKSSRRKGSKASADPMQCPHLPGRCSRERGRVLFVSRI
ncbi:translation initiation factor IF-2-like [Strigops habroptila]|uniref:translation initiation factor IF-2-like n=1 Tax=Strigops habroptila TaxID=2489341 RepID=UPI0011CF0FF1|nr:translation initiation factor IF-2-like [Strigops habroptila]